MTIENGVAGQVQPNGQTPSPEGETTAKADPPNPAKFKPITTQEELDQRLGARLYEERAKYSDYEELKAAKAKLDKLEAEGKSELEKANDRAAAAEAKAVAYEKAQKQAGWRMEIRQENGLPESVDPLLTGETLEEIKAKADILAANFPQKQVKAYVRSDTGQNITKSGSGGDDSFAELAAALTGG